MKFDEFKKRIAKGLAGAYVFAGDEPYFRREGFRLLAERFLASGGKQTGILDLAGERAQAAEIADELSTDSLWGSGRLVLVGEADGLIKRQGEILAGYLARPAPGSTLAIGCESLDMRTAFAREAKKLDAIVECRKLYDTPYDPSAAGEPTELSRWILGEARAKGMRLSGEAALRLGEVVGNDPAAIAEELDKLALYSGGAPVESDAVERVAGAGRRYAVFKLTDAVASRDLRLAMEVCGRIFAEGLAGKEGAIHDHRAIAAITIGQLALLVERLWKAKRLMGSGDPARAAGELGLPPRFAGILLRRAEGFAEGELQEAQEAVLEADLAGKTGRAADPQSLVESLLAGICARSRAFSLPEK